MDTYASTRRRPTEIRRESFRFISVLNEASISCNNALGTDQRVRYQQQIAPGDKPDSCAKSPTSPLIELVSELSYDLACQAVARPFENGAKLEQRLAIDEGWQSVVVQVDNHAQSSRPSRAPWGWPDCLVGSGHSTGNTDLRRSRHMVHSPVSPVFELDRDCTIRV